MSERERGEGQVTSFEDGYFTLSWFAVLLLMGLGYIAGNYVALRWWKKEQTRLAAHVEMAIAQERARADTLASVVDRLTGGGPTAQELEPTVGEASEPATDKLA